MTLLKLDKSDKDFLARFCAECTIPVDFYTMEMNEDMILCKVHTDNQSILFSLGKMVGMAKIHEEWKRVS